MIADVIVDIAASETDRIYSYLCDDTVAEGSRVYAPFGGRVTAGFVVALRDSCDYPAEKLKKVTAADPMPALNAECLSACQKNRGALRLPAGGGAQAVSSRGNAQRQGARTEKTLRRALRSV